ncbi:VOC family protein [Nitratireductor kimnyeongensis]|uniref:VOC family protein n=1 Tax=Nitratireductor kimnyeongensis TaxID=430679 RepID=A0ABW0T2M7_9HYPH|nr:VOC family protein [Nitratireductor kimnyeongensis]QZZ35329.1 VOC family protein [Nitratireductor kimnyeongensis]
MNQFVSTEPPRIYPTFRYRDAVSMIDWLTKAFGFRVHASHEHKGRIVHAELALGSSMIMVGEAVDDPYGDLVGAAGQAGGKSTYVAVDDADMVFAKAKHAGATILQNLRDTDYGSRDFICADPEGNVWCFGTYWPKAHENPGAE